MRHFPSATQLFSCWILHCFPIIRHIMLASPSALCGCWERQFSAMQKFAQKNKVLHISSKTFQFEQKSVHESNKQDNDSIIVEKEKQSGKQIADLWLQRKNKTWFGKPAWHKSKAMQGKRKSKSRSRSARQERRKRRGLRETTRERTCSGSEKY